MYPYPEFTDEQAVAFQQWKASNPRFNLVPSAQIDMWVLMYEAFQVGWESGIKEAMKKTVIKATQSPNNPTRWSLDLECGHEMWVTAVKPPKKAECHSCEPKS
jgi:hypothetical protein